jgi:putative ABC transport system permease protein
VNSVRLVDLDLWHEILQTLQRNRLRTFLTACGIFWGVFMLVVMLGFGHGLQSGVRNEFGIFAFNTVFVWGQQTDVAFEGRPPGRPVRLTLDDVTPLRRIPGVELVLPRNSLEGRPGQPNVISRGQKSMSFQVSGEEAEYLRLEPLQMSSGRFLNPADLAETRKVAVIGRRVVEGLFGKGVDPVGKAIAINGVSVTVVGVYRTDESGPRGDWFAGRVFIPRTTLARAFVAGPWINGMAILVGPQRRSTEVEADVRAFLLARHHAAPDDLRAIGSFNREKEFHKVDALFTAIQTLSWFVGLLTLLAGALGVSNIMMIAVAERTREIGIRKALGATPFTIISQIIAESTLLTALAGYLGLVVGVGVLELAGQIIERMSHGPGPQLFARPEVDLGVAIAATVVLTLAGAMAGLAPARVAVAIHPVAALAHE